MEMIYESTKDTAKKIRKELKKEFPDVKFSVRSSNYSGGSSINVNWTDGPTQKEVEKVTDRFNSASFDSMQDLKTTPGYEWEGKIYNGADYIFANREMSAEYRIKIEAHAEKIFEDFNKNDWTYHSKMIQAEKDFLKIKELLEEKEGDIIVQKTEENQPIATVIDFKAEKMKRMKDRLTPEQQFKLLALEALMQEKEDELQAFLNKGFTIDQVFTTVAKIFFNEEAVQH